MSLFSNLSTLFISKSGQTQSANKQVVPAAPQTDQKSRPLPQPVPLKVQVTKGGKPSDAQPVSVSKPGASDQAIKQTIDQPTETLSKPQVTSPAPSPITTSLQGDQVVREAQSRAREIIVEAKAEALSIRAKVEAEIREQNKQIEEQQRNLERKLDRIDARLEQQDERETKLVLRTKDLDDREAKAIEKEKSITVKLEEVSGLTAEEARTELFENLEKSLKKDMAHTIRQREEEAKTQADERVQEILVDAMRLGATDYVAEYTVSVVQLPSEEDKGKIIGKAGRNINAFERETGVDVDLDMSPTEVRLSCFDPVRREIGRIALERLIKDGRIQPARIEEVVAKVRQEIDKITFEAGKQLCHELGVYNLPLELMQLIGKFKYRFSYGQNLIAHTLEETRIGMKLASELKLDVNIVKLGCLLHDIGKVSDEPEGSHVELGIKIAKRFNLPQTVIDCIAQHHEDEPFSGPEQMVVYIADAISGARPGARYENYDEYVARLTKLEEISTAYKEVKSAYAIQAGREIRVILAPEISKDDDVVLLSRQIRDEIKEKVTYPGTVTVTVIRETRAREVAK